MFCPGMNNAAAVHAALGGATENARHEFARVEIAGHENAGPTLQGWKMREKLVRKAKV